jgi:hypothetical protein
MKKILLILFVGWISNMHAQTSVYHPFPDSNATWNIFFSGGILASCLEEFSYLLNGDTVISNHTYHKIMVPYIHNYGFCGPIHPSGYNGGIRQDTSARKVYYLAPDSLNEEVLYDFSLQIGDSLPGSLWFNCYTSTLAVIAIDSILIGTNYRKRWTTGHAIPYNPHNYIIEGIGFETGLLQQCPESFADAPFYSLICFQQNGTTLYPDALTNCLLIDNVKNLLPDSVFEIFPNPFQNFLTVISKSNEPSEIILYDLAMRKLQQQTFVNNVNLNTDAFAKGVYIYEIRNHEGTFSRGKVVKE